MNTASRVSLIVDLETLVNSWHCNRHTTTPNDPPNSSQLEPSSQLRWSWVSIRFATSLVSRERSATQAILPATWLELDRVGLNLIKLKFSPNSSQVSTVWPPQSTLAKLVCYCYAVTTRSYSDNTELFLARWLDLAASFGQPSFVTWLELARVGSTVWPRLWTTNFRPCHTTTVTMPFIAWTETSIR